MTSPPPLDASLAESILRGYGLISAEAPLRCTPLTGGVSSIVLLAESSGRRYVAFPARAGMGRDPPRRQSRARNGPLVVSSR